MAARGSSPAKAQAKSQEGAAASALETTLESAKVWRFFWRLPGHPCLERSVLGPLWCQLAFANMVGGA